MLPLHEVKTPTEPEKSENGYVTVLKWVSQRQTQWRDFIIAFFAGTFPSSWSCWLTYQQSWDSTSLTCIFLGWDKYDFTLTNPYACVQITQQRGLSKSESALLISLIGFFNTGGRIVSGAVTDHPKVDALFMTFLALSWGAVCPFLMTFCYDFWSYTVVCIMFGVSLSAWPAVTSSMLVSWAQHSPVPLLISFYRLRCWSSPSWLQLLGCSPAWEELAPSWDLPSLASSLMQLDLALTWPPTPR